MSGEAAPAPANGASAKLAEALRAVRTAQAPKVSVPERTTSDELRELLEEARKAIGLALERDGIADTDARFFLVAIAASLAVQEAMVRRQEECLSAAVVELRRGINAEDAQAIRAMIAQAAVSAMPTGEERALFVRQVIEAVKAGMPAPPALDLKAIEKAAEAGAHRGARLRQEGEGASKRGSPLVAAITHPAVLVAAGTLIGAAIARLV